MSAIAETTTATTTTRRKKASVDAVKRSSEDDHRRKRRNRMTQSCLNCHTSKRMCDRKRPCGRCTQLGLTGLCVYEVDDPNQRNEVPDEQARLQKRVAELESVIRELKNKPHPRWVQNMPPGSDTPSKRSPPTIAIHPADLDGDSAMRAGSSGSSSPTIELHLPNDPVPHLSPPSPSNLLSSPSSSRSSGNSPSPIPTPPSPLALTPIDGHPPMHGSIPHGCDLTSLLSPYFESSGLNGILDGLLGCDGTSMSEPCFDQRLHETGGHCGCLHDTKSYNVILELSVRLRRAADILASSPKHSHGSDCSMHQRISALDKFTTEILANISSPVASYPTFSQHQHQPQMSYAASSRSSANALTMEPTVSPQALQGVRPWDFRGQSNSYPSPPSEDSFMSWEPVSRRPDWPQSGRR
ncbi:hypothetical protein QCA50_004380 [Cerrena zonata]|uniref:Zn(2)-C6 fungal-type domain-containing protein n=1 Tax=Cerrena zonata TaxID=2478898 RepID=A0AAW0GLE3_9APHY